MANHKSAKKRARQNIKRNERNKAYLSKVRTAVKNFTEAVKEGKSDLSGEPFSSVQSILHKAAKKGLIKDNNASRKIKRLAKSIKPAQASA